MLVTPEYNRSAPPSLKHAIDCAREEWYAKPVAFVTYGGMARGLRAGEHLRLVLGELHAVALRDGVAISIEDGSVDDTGWVRDTGGAANAAKVVLDRLEWWGTSLRTARADRPYAR